MPWSPRSTASSRTVRDTRTKLAAAYDPEANAWSELSASGTLGIQVWRGGSSLYLNPHFRNAGGGIYGTDVNR